MKTLSLLSTLLITLLLVSCVSTTVTRDIKLIGETKRVLGCKTPNILYSDFYCKVLVDVDGSERVWSVWNYQGKGSKLSLWCNAKYRCEWYAREIQ